MSDELRAGVYWQSPATTVGRDRLTHAYIADADDENPPTPERLRAAGFVDWPKGINRVLSYGGPVMRVIRILPDPPYKPEWRVEYNETRFESVNIPTMSAVRAAMRFVDAANAEGGAG